MNQKFYKSARVKVKPDIWRMLKARAALEGKSLESYIGEILEQFVNERVR